MKDASAVCFTTEEGDDFSSENFWPFSCKQIVTGLGVGDPPAGEVNKKPYLRKNSWLVQKKNSFVYG